MNLDQFTKKYLPGLRLLPVSLPTYLPGTVLEEKGHELRKLGHLRQILGGGPEQWRLDYPPASIVYGQIEETKDVGAGLSLLGIVRIGGVGKKKVRVSWRLTSVRGCEFHEQSQLTLQPLLNELKQQDKARWDLVNDKLVVTESFFATQVTLRFETAGSLMAEAEVKQVVPVDVDANVVSEWQTTGELVISENTDVPFGVRGFKV